MALEAPTPSTLSSSGPVLDYTAFPHILDVIISYSPWKSLLALRGASKETRDRIDKDLLGKYLIFTQIGTLQYGIKVTAPNGHEHPAFAMWSPEWNPGMEDDDDDDGMETHSGIVAFPIHDPSHSLAVAAAAHSFDLAEALPHRTFTRFLDLLPAQPPVIRWLRNECLFPRQRQTGGVQSQTNVVFSHQSADAPSALAGFLLSDLLELGDRWVLHLTVEPRVLVHCLATWGKVPGPRHEKAPEKELVLIMQPTGEVRETTAADAQIHNPLLPFGSRFGPFDCNFATALEIANITLVGFNDLPSFLFHARNGTPRELQDRIFAAHETVAEQFRALRQEDSLRDLERVTILTLEEYRNTVSAEQFAFETVEDTRDFGPRLKREIARR